MFHLEIYLNLSLLMQQLNRTQAIVVLLLPWTIQVLVKSGATTNVSSTQLDVKLRKMQRELPVLVGVVIALVVASAALEETSHTEATTEVLGAIIGMEALVAADELKIFYKITNDYRF